MPEIGEIRRGREGYKSLRSKFKWLACLDCGKERWVRIVREEPCSMRCPKCGSIYSRLWGNANPSWKGGRTTLRGYIWVKVPRNDFFYPMTGTGEYVAEHRLIM